MTPTMADTCSTTQCGVDCIRSLNRDCYCVSLNQQALADALLSELGEEDLFQLLLERCPTIFASYPVFVSSLHMERMAAVIAAVEEVVALPAYRAHIRARSPDAFRPEPDGTLGAFMGYDFHVAEDGFGLIEINTNAGGAMLNAVLARAQRACCLEIEGLLPPPALAGALERNIVAMFRREWALTNSARPLTSLAIVDEDPGAQYLYPEFLLFQRLLQRNGIDTVVADPGELSMKEGRLYHGTLPIDLVYNRLTDFSLTAPSSSSLRQAWEQQAVVVTPNPETHALYADKRNLILLSDPESLKALDVPAATREILLGGIPVTRAVAAMDADVLWSERKRLFFKPAAGYGSRAAYRGDKLTRRVWQEILAGDYVAQQLVTPGERSVSASDPSQVLKFDLRNYVYDTDVLWVAARLYQGQTTNFRTQGGGFAPVYAGVPEVLAQLS